MPCYENNVYYYPENFDPPLRKVAEVDAFEPDYSFDIFLVVQVVEDGRVFVASDSGCSCPAPFEDHNSLADDFTEVHSWAEVKAEYERRFPDDSYRSRVSLSNVSNAITGAFRRGA